MTYNADNSRQDRTFNAVQEVAASGYDFNFDLKIVENELKGFIASIYKFFYDLEECDFKLAAERLQEIDDKTTGLLDDIDQRQIVLFMMDPGPFPDVDTNEFLRAVETSTDDISSLDLSEDAAVINAAPKAGGRAKWNLDGAPAKFAANGAFDFSLRAGGRASDAVKANDTFNLSAKSNKGAAGDRTSSRRNENAADRTLSTSRKKKSRDANRSAEHSNTFRAMERTTNTTFGNKDRTNLYRAKNYENLHGLFDFE